MSFSVKLESDTFTVEPGSSVAVAVEVTNSGETSDHFELSVEGLDPQWSAIPTPSFRVEPGETIVERFFLKPARESDSSAGDYPFVTKIRSLESGDSKTAQGVLEIKPFHHLSVDADPRRITISGAKPENTFTLTVMNLGNVEQSLQLFATDTDDEFVFEFDRDQVVLPPGGQVKVGVGVTAMQKMWFSSTRLHPITLSARNIENPAVAASVQAQVEQRPLVSPGLLGVIVFAFLLLTFWIVTIPKAPVVNALSINPSSVMVNDPVKIVWRTSHADSVTLIIGKRTIENQPDSGEFTFQPDEAGTFGVAVYALSGKRQSSPREGELKVNVPEQVPDPKIEDLSGPSKVKCGEQFTIRFRVNDAVTRLTLEPIGTMDPKSSSIQVTSPNSPGTQTYTLIATNAEGKVVRREIKVEFEKLTAAKIVKFSADPLEVDPLSGLVTISWQTAGAFRLELSYNGQTIELDQNGRRDIQIIQDTEFTLTAYDIDGLTATKTVSVKLKEEPVAEPTTGGGGVTPPPLDPPGGGSGGGRTVNDDRDGGNAPRRPRPATTSIGN
ncbi:MAG: hypothetical protein KDC26_05080 [Armatimonadetes bacterium]|nr:hypothetical protein [Armatimonadota bacterium]